MHTHLIHTHTHAPPNPGSLAQDGCHQALRGKKTPDVLIVPPEPALPIFSPQLMAALSSQFLRPQTVAHLTPNSVTPHLPPSKQSQNQIPSPHLLYLIQVTPVRSPLALTSPVLAQSITLRAARGLLNCESGCHSTAATRPSPTAPFHSG